MEEEDQIAKQEQALMHGVDARPEYDETDKGHGQQLCRTTTRA